MAEIRYPNYKTGQEESIDFIVLNLGYVQLLRDWGNKDISSPFARIYYVRRGNAMLHLPQGDIQVKPGCMYMVPNYVPHSYECQRGFGFYYLFVFQRIRRQADIFDRFEFPIEVPSSEATRQLFSSYCHLYPQLHLPVHDATAFDSHPAFREYAHAFSRMEFYERMQLHGLVAIVFSYFMKGARPRVISTDMRIARLVDYVQQHIADSISIDELADIACLTKPYLIRMFRNSLGTTPLQYIIRKKVQKAQALLLDTDQSVAAIARAVGMQDASYFIRLFRKNLGVTPQEYRQKLIG